MTATVFALLVVLLIAVFLAPRDRTLAEPFSFPSSPSSPSFPSSSSPSSSSPPSSSTDPPPAKKRVSVDDGNELQAIDFLAESVADLDAVGWAL